MKHYNNSRVNDTIQKHEGIHIREPTYMDAYNKTIKQDGISGCIRCGVDFRNMDFVIIPEQSGGVILYLLTQQVTAWPDASRRIITKYHLPICSKTLVSGRAA